MPKPTPRAVALLVVLAIAAGACSGDDGDAATTTSDVATTTAPTTTAPADNTEPPGDAPDLAGSEWTLVTYSLENLSGVDHWLIARGNLLLRGEEAFLEFEPVS